MSKMTDRPPFCSTITRPVLVTGFGAFPGVPNNCSTDFARAVVHALQNATETLPAVHAVLDVDWNTISDQVRDLYAQHKPHLAVHFGVASDRSGLCLETTARNTCADDCDAVGQRPGQAVLQPVGPATRVTGLPIEAMIRESNIDTIVVAASCDAGRYLCNAAYYTSLSLAHQGDEGRDALFIHMPATLTPNSPEWSEFVSAAVEIVKSAATHLADKQPR